MAPLREKYPRPDSLGIWETYRFSLNGLIIHIENSGHQNISGNSLGNLIVGSNEKLFLITQDYHYSREKEHTEQSILEHSQDYIKFKKM